MAQIKFQLKHGLPYGKGDNVAMQYDVSLRELNVGDMLQAQEESEKVVATPSGYTLVMSPTRLGINTIRRQIHSVGTIQGPLSLADMERLHPEDLTLINRHLDGLETAVLQEVEGRGRDSAPSEEA